MFARHHESLQLILKREQRHCEKQQERHKDIERFSPVQSSRRAPTTPPIKLVGSNIITLLRWPTRSRRCANAPPKYPGHNATVFVIFAVTAGSPAATSAGNEIKLPPPAIALTSPAASPVPAISVTDATSKLCIELYLLDACLPAAELFVDRFQPVNANAQRPILNVQHPNEEEIPEPK